MPIPSGPISHPWRRFLRFSVRGLVVFVVVIGAGLGWTVRQAHIQRDAVAAIERDAGRVDYSWEQSDGVTLPEGKPWARPWLVDLIGVDYFVHVTTVQFPMSSKPTDSTIARVGSLTRLRSLFDYSSSVSDAGLAHLTGLTDLEELELFGTPVTDAGLMHLTGLTKLHSLILTDTHVTDAGLIHLKSMKGLSALSLRGTQVTDAGLVHLRRLTDLSYLDLDSSVSARRSHTRCASGLPRAAVVWSGPPSLAW
jgi:hypothetical protein